MNSQEVRKTLLESVLGRGSWFQGLPGTLRDSLRDHAVVRQFSRDSVVVEEGEQAEGLYCILEGQLKFSMRISADCDYLLHLAGPGAWFGEAPVLLHGVSLCTVRAATAGHLAFLSLSQFNRVAELRSEWYRPLSELFARRYGLALRQLAEVTQLSREQYLRRRLADLAVEQQIDSGAGRDVELALSQSELASMVGVSRQTINVYLQRLEKEGLIRCSFRVVVVSDPSVLSASVGAAP